MKNFLTKTLNILLVIISLFVYQHYALERQAVVDAYEEEQLEAENLAAQYRKDEEEAEKLYNEALNAAMNPESTVSAEPVIITGYREGTYRETAQGFGGDIILDVVISNDAVTDVRFISYENEDAAYFEQAITVVDEVIKRGNTDGVDTVSGATFSSGGILDAIDMALEEAWFEESCVIEEQTPDDSGASGSSDAAAADANPEGEGTA